MQKAAVQLLLIAGGMQDKDPIAGLSSLQQHRRCQVESVSVQSGTEKRMQQHRLPCRSQQQWQEVIYPGTSRTWFSRLVRHLHQACLRKTHQGQSLRSKGQNRDQALLKAFDMSSVPFVMVAC